MFWLQDLLPERFPDCAVYSVGNEDAHDDGPMAEWWLSETTGLLSHLQSTPLAERTPILFIAHGFGGIYLEMVRTTRPFHSLTNESGVDQPLFMAFRGSSIQKLHAVGGLSHRCHIPR